MPLIRSGCGSGTNRIGYSLASKLPDQCHQSSVSNGLSLFWLAEGRLLARPENQRRAQAIGRCACLLILLAVPSRAVTRSMGHHLRRPFGLGNGPLIFPADGCGNHPVLAIFAKFGTLNGVRLVSVLGGGGDSARQRVCRSGVGVRWPSDRSAKVELRDFNPGRERIR